MSQNKKECVMIENTNTQQADAERISSQELLKGNSKVVIEHNHVDYILRVTKENKLILTK
jgi:hemin uptake protein HemP